MVDGIDGDKWALLMTQTHFMLSPPKITVQEPRAVTSMTNQDSVSYKNGFESNGHLPHFDHNADTGDNPNAYNKASILITTPPKESTTFLSFEAPKKPTSSADDAKN